MESGSKLGPYEIIRELGRGGMGVVYLARDTRLDRDVAIKALPEHLAQDPDRLARFEREAKTLAQLNHSNVAGIHGIEEHNDARHLVLEYVEGETLADRLDRGALPVDEALEIAVQIAAGVEAAHEAGVIHRDLKPGNVMITSDGKAKVLDFGLARSEETSSSTGASPTDPTITSPAMHSPTMPGVILGTAAYMSPEQARGRKVDKRTDIWSFGVILYEMLTGISPFIGETVGDSIGAVLHKDLDLNQLPPATPSGVRRVIRRCTERDRALRCRDIGDVRLELLRAGDDSDMPAVTDRRHSARVWGLVAVVLAVVAATGWGLALWRGAGDPPAPRKLDVMVETEHEPLGDFPRISPDGKRLAYLMDRVVHVRDFSSFESRALTNTHDAVSLFWSPDSEWIGYLTGSAVYKVALRGGGATKLADAPDSLTDISGGGWTADDRIIFGTGRDLYAIPARGGEPSVLLTSDAEALIDLHDPSVMTGTNVALFAEHYTPMKMAITAFDGRRRIEVVSVDDYTVSPTYSPTGHILYTRGMGTQDLWAVGFDVGRMEVTGDPFLVMPDTVQPSVSLGRTLVVRRGGTGMSGELVWVTTAGEIDPVGIEVSGNVSPTIAPDESRIAYSRGESGRRDVWVHDLWRGSNSRVSFLEGLVGPAAWSPDGREIATRHFAPATDTIARTHFYAADGSGETRAAIDLGGLSFDTQWSRMVGLKTGQDSTIAVHEAELDDPASVTEVLQQDMVIPSAALSPDWSLLAFAQSGSGRPEVYCTRYPESTGRWQASTDGGTMPTWSPDGKTLYFLSNDFDAIFSVEVTREPAPQFGMPQKVVDGKTLRLELGSGWAPSADGDRFLVVKENKEEGTRAAISVITNWWEEFRER